VLEHKVWLARMWALKMSVLKILLNGRAVVVIKKCCFVFSLLGVNLALASSSFFDSETIELMPPMSESGLQQQASFDPAYQWTIQAPNKDWDSGIPLGNGLMGCLVWGEGNTIQFGFDRADIWENRMNAESLKAVGLTYEIMQKMVKEGKTKEIGDLTRKHTDNVFPDGKTKLFATKLPGVRLELELPSGFNAKSFTLDMGQGLGSVVPSNGVPIQVFTSATTPVTLIKCADFSQMKWIPAWQVRKLGYPDGEVGSDGGNLWFKQETGGDFEYGAYAAIKKMNGQCLIAVSIASTEDSPDYIALAKKQAEEALKEGYDQLFESQKKWWTSFWSASEIRLPDLRLERYYHLMQYLYGAGSRPNHPPLALQGLWTSATGGLPPWKGDYHNDLNVQMTYWAYYTSGHFEQGESVINFYNELTPVFRKFAKDFFDVDGLMAPTVMGLKGQAFGGWVQYTLSPVEASWILQNFYWHWRYTMDRDFLKNTCYPFCKGFSTVITSILKEDENGKLKLPLSSSPELFSNSERAWMTPNSNNDLSIMIWLFRSMAEMADELGLNEEVEYWNQLGAKLDDLAVDTRKVLRVSPDVSLSESHRHLSHLMAIYPLGILNIEGSQADKEIIYASMDDYPTYGVKRWKGYSFAWLSCMEARAGRPDKSLEYLDIFVNNYVSKNGFHLNRKQRDDLNSPIAMEGPFTLEGNFAASQAIHEMLLQSWGGVLRIFPSVPEKWKDLSFEKLRAEGGFIVSAEMQAGKTIKLEVVATANQVLRIRKTPANAALRWNRELDLQGNDLVIKLNAGERLIGMGK